MRQSKLIGKTLKEVPKDAVTVSHKLMLRAGYIKQLSAGIYSYLPLLFRTLTKISQIIREELDKRGCQELLMPALQPKELWEESGRWERYVDVDGIMFAFKDRRGAENCLGPTHEEVVTDIVRREVSSYRDLPVILYQIQTKFRDEVRPRFGLMRAREFIMKDAYSFDIDEQGLDRSYELMKDAYNSIFQRIGFHYKAVQADSGAIGGEGSQEFMVLAESGEDTILYCDACDYSANQEKAESRIKEYPQDEELKEMEEVYGEGIIGAEALAEFLKIPIWKTTKTILYQADDKIVAVMVRGDCDVNELKVQNFLNCKVLKLADADTVKRVTGAEVGYAGPIGLPDDVIVLADLYTKNRVNFECGANKTNYHNINVNMGRDFKEPIFGDFKLAKGGDMCPRCDEGTLRSAKGIEVGHIFKLGTKYSTAMKAEYVDEQGRRRPIVMGCYGIGVTRIAAAAVEQNHDDKGIIWPASIAPFHVHLIGLNLEESDVRAQAEQLYNELGSLGFEVLYDDRELRAGEKFNDADLIGIPVRLTISRKTLKQNKIELKMRWEKESVVLEKKEAIERIKAVLK